MDIISLIEEQVKRIRELSHDLALEKVVIHINRAEKYYCLGKESGDDAYFTDVIYRTNQAFEGSLRQAYKVLAGKTEKQANAKRTVDIETYFASSGIFKPRVLRLFQNYRQEWRNESVHDFQLFFDENEAFLAIVNVSAYSNLLFSQIIERLAFLNEQRLLMEEKNKRKRIVDGFNDGNRLIDKIVNIIKVFSIENELLESNPSESEIIGAFSAVLTSASKDIVIEAELAIKVGSMSYRPDLVIKYKDEKIIVEVKRFWDAKSMGNEEQVLRYLNVSNIENGILWYPKNYPSEKLMNIEEMLHWGRDANIVVTISPLEFFDH